MKGADHQYLIHRWPEDERVASPSADSALIFGGERLAVAGGEEGIWRDDDMDPVISDALHRGLAHVVKLLPDAEPEMEQLHASHEWTGIMGYTSDGSPWVGPVPETLSRGLGAGGGAGGLWVSAGYSGHGMPVAARCGVAVAEMMLGRRDGIEVPRQWLASDERAGRARYSRLPATVDELLATLPAETVAS